MAEQEAPPLDAAPDETPVRRRPTRADFDAFDQLQATVLDRTLEKAKVWRNGYAMLAAGSGALLALIGDRLGEATPWGWRLALTLAFGGGILLTAAALWMTLTIDGGAKATTINLNRIVEEHNSVAAYRADQAAVALRRLDRSKWAAVFGAGLCFLGLLVTLWIPTAPAADPGPPPPPQHRLR